MSAQIKYYAEALIGALAFGWALFTEFRLRQAQDANEIMKRKLSDVTIEKAVNAEPDASVLNDLQQVIKQ